MPVSMRNIEKITVFAFGVIFLVAINVLLWHKPNPTNAQFFAIRLTMALCSAGIGALLPGFLRLELPLTLQGGIRAGGALALFVSVWFVTPKPIIPDDPNRTLESATMEDVPKEDATKLIDHFLNLTDALNHTEAYALLSKRYKQNTSNDTYLSLGRNVRDPLGNVENRRLVSTQNPIEINGARGPYVVHTYQSRFSGTKDVWMEIVSTIPENGAWRINSYEVIRCVPPLCTPPVSLFP